MNENMNEFSKSEKYNVSMNYALWADRAVAALIDIGIALLFMLIIFVLMWVIMLIFNLIAAGLSSTGTKVGQELGLLSSFGGCGICCFSFILPPISYWIVGLLNKTYWVSKRGYSIGQGVMRLRVVNANGDFLSMQTAFMRLLCQIGLALIPIIGPFFDLVYPLFDEPTRQTLHDKAVGTFVIKTEESPNFFPKKST